MSGTRSRAGWCVLGTSDEDPDSRLWRDRRSQSLAFWQLVGLYATSDVNAESSPTSLMERLIGQLSDADSLLSQALDSTRSSRDRTAAGAMS